MPNYTIIAEVIQTRCYTVQATSANEAKDIITEEFETMPYDLLEQDLDTMEVEEID